MATISFALYAQAHQVTSPPNLQVPVPHTRDSELWMADTRWRTLAQSYQLIVEAGASDGRMDSSQVPVSSLICFAPVYGVAPMLEGGPFYVCIQYIFVMDVVAVLKPIYRM